MAAKDKRTPIAVRRATRAIADDIVIWRKLRGLTQSQLADRADIGVRTLSRLEDGESVSFEAVVRVLRALGVLELLVAALDPYASEVGRLRADEQLPQRVRTARVREAGDA